MKAFLACLISSNFRVRAFVYAWKVCWLIMRIIFIQFCSLLLVYDFYLKSCGNLWVHFKSMNFTECIKMRAKLSSIGSLKMNFKAWFFSSLCIRQEDEKQPQIVTILWTICSEIQAVCIVETSKSKSKSFWSKIYIILWMSCDADIKT